MNPVLRRRRRRRSSIAARDRHEVAGHRLGRRRRRPCRFPVHCASDNARLAATATTPAHPVAIDHCMSPPLACYWGLACRRMAGLRRVWQTSFIVRFHRKLQSTTFVRCNTRAAPAEERDQSHDAILNANATRGGTVATARCSIAGAGSSSRCLRWPARPRAQPTTTRSHERALARVDAQRRRRRRRRALHDGAAVNSRNRLGESALLIALKKNRADLAQLAARRRRRRQPSRRSTASRR